MSCNRSPKRRRRNHPTRNESRASCSRSSPRISLITGGAGFIGSHVADRLLEAGERVIVLDDLSTGSKSNLSKWRGCGRLEFVEGSVLDERLVRDLVSRCDRVFHLAAAVGVGLVVKQPMRSLETNVIGSFNVIRACVQKKRPLLVTSSSEVYGKSNVLPFREDADIMLGPSECPRWSYACSKAIAEFYAQSCAASSSSRTVIVRLFNTCGPRQTGRYGMVVPRFVAQGLAGKPITVYGTGNQIRCFAHVLDIAEGIISLMDCGRAWRRTVNLGSDRPVTINRLAETVKRLTGGRSEIVRVPFQTVYGDHFEDMEARQPDLSVARALIDYRPVRTLEEIIRDVIAHMKPHFAPEA